MKHRKKLIYLLVLLIILVSFMTNYSNISHVNAAGRIKLNKKSIKLVVGKSATLKVKGLTKKQRKKVKWSSSNNSVVAVNKNGRIKAKSEGTVFIYAKYKRKKYKCKVNTYYDRNTVISSDIHKLYLDVDEVSYIPIKTDRGLPFCFNASNENVELFMAHWNDEANLRLAIVGLSPGSTEVTVYDEKDPRIKTIIQVYVKPPSIELHMPIHSEIPIDTWDGNSVVGQMSVDWKSVQYGYNYDSDKYDLDVCLAITILNKSDYLNPKGSYKIEDMKGDVVYSSTFSTPTDLWIGDTTVVHLIINGIEPGEYSFLLGDYKK